MEENNGIVVNLEESREDEDREIHLSDVFDIDRAVEEHGKKLVVVAGTGAGKSTWVKEVLTQKGRVLFVTSRKIKVKADTEASCFSEVFKWGTEDNQTLITNAKLAYLIRNIVEDTRHDIEEFLNHFDYIVIDEVHSIATDSAFADSCPHVLSFIEYAVEKGKTVIAMTGTLEPMKWYFQQKKWKILDYTSKCKYVHPRKVYLAHLYDVEKIVMDNWGKRKIIYFVNRTDTIHETIEKLLDKEIVQADKVAAIVSKSKEKKFLSELVNHLGKETASAIKETTRITYDSIVQTNDIPNECNMLFSTSALKEGIDILNEDVVMICENHIMTNLIQFFGRVRGKGTEVYITKDSIDHPVNSWLLIGEYAAKHEQHSANAFLTERIMSDKNVQAGKAEKQKEEFIRYIEEKNPYIYFDYVFDRFRVFKARMMEELRLEDSRSSWKKELSRHCHRYGISKDETPDLRKYIRDLLAFVVADGKSSSKRFGESRDAVMRLIQFGYNIKAKQWNKMNDELKAKNAPIRILSRTETKVEHRDENYWMLVPADYTPDDSAEREEEEYLLEVFNSQSD